MCILLLLGVVPMICTPVLGFGKSIGESFSLVFLGYYVFSREDVIEKIKKYTGLCTGITIVVSAIYVIFFVWMEQHDIILVKACHHIAKWFGILAFLGFGNRYLNGSNRFTKYMSANSFSIYIYHFLWIVVIQYYIGKCITNIVVLYVISVVGALGLTILTIEILKRIPGIRFLFAMKKDI